MSALCPKEKHCVYYTGLSVCLALAMEGPTTSIIHPKMFTMQIALKR